jgi:DEAD/DEAH box helicase domain-containing protein
VTELLVSWLRRQNPELSQRVRGYRSGFLPEERRSIEQRLFSGELDGVISTSALEMGIDVGGLDACILVGYPGSMMATWQRSGRAGRGSRESLTALVALPDALDQYFLAHPDEFLERPCERLIVDPGNLPVSRAHLVCAAAELSLTAERDGAGTDEGTGYLDRYGALVESMVDDQVLVRSGDGSELYSFQRRPHGRVSLRGSGANYEIVDGTTGELVGTIDGVRVLHECHPGAVYLHGGRQYQVETLDQDLHHVVASPAEVEYFTTALTEKETEILEVSASRTPTDEQPLAAHLARVRVTERVVGFERKQIGSQELLSQHPLDELPPSIFETVGVLWVAPKAFEDHLRRAEEHWLGALHATEHAAISLVPLLALCDRGDIGGISYPRHPQVGAGAVFVYDGHPGGVGIAERVFAELAELLGRVLALLDACPCDAGCPSCVQSPKCGNGNRPLDKSGARRVLRLLLGEERPETAVEHPVLTLDLDDDGRAALVPPERRARPAPAPLPLPAPEPEEPRRPEASGMPEPFEAPRLPERPLVLVPEPASDPVLRDEPITVLFDIETRRSAREVGGWGNPHKMGVALAVALVLEEGRFEVFDESRVGELVALLERARLVVGYNSRRFDYGVLSGYTGVDYRRTLPTLDLMDDVRRASGARVGLDHLARETLGQDQGKSGDGLQCLQWVKEGRMDLVESYCRRDVEVLRDVYLHGRREGFVRLRHRKKGLVEVPVAW